MWKHAIWADTGALYGQRVIAVIVSALVYTIAALSPACADYVPSIVSFRSDGQSAVLAVGGTNPYAVVFDSYTGQTWQNLVFDESDDVTALEFGRAKDILAAGTASGRVKLWRGDVGLPGREFDFPGQRITRLHFAPGDAHLAMVLDGRTLAVWDESMLTADIPLFTDLVREPIRSVQFHREYGELFVGLESGAVERYSWTEGLRRSSARECSSPIVALDLSSGRVPPRPRSDLWWEIIESPVPQYRLVALDADGGLHLMNAPSGGPLKRLDYGGVLRRTIALTADGRVLAAGTDTGEIELWSARTGTPIGSLVGHTGAVLSLGFSGDGRRLLSLSADGTVRTWELFSRAELARFAVQPVSLR